MIFKTIYFIYFFFSAFSFSIIVFVSTDPSIEDGKFYTDFKDSPNAEESRIEEDQERFWQLSEKIVA